MRSEQNQVSNTTAEFEQVHHEECDRCRRWYWWWLGQSRTPIRVAVTSSDAGHDVKCKRTIFRHYNFDDNDARDDVWDQEVVNSIWRRASVDRGSAFPNLHFFLVNAYLIEQENFENRPRPKFFSTRACKAPPLTVRWPSTSLVRYRDGLEFFEHSFLRIWEVSNAHDLFEERLRAQDAFFREEGRSSDFLTETTVHGPQEGSSDRTGACHVLQCNSSSLVKKSAFLFCFLIFQRNSSITKTLMQQGRKDPGRYHSCAVLPIWLWCAGRISVSLTSRSSV